MKEAKSQGNHKEVARLSEINNHLILGKVKKERRYYHTITTITEFRFKNLCAMAGVDWSLAAHQLRSTFGNYVVHSELGDLRALIEHFKYWSITMTVLYAANDDLDQERFEELLREKLFVEEEIFSDFFALDDPITGGAVADRIKEFRSSEEAIMAALRKWFVQLSFQFALQASLGVPMTMMDGCMHGRRL